MNIFTILKGSQFYFYLLLLQLVLCRTSSIVQIIFSFCSFEISEGILRNQKFIIGLDSFFKPKFNIFGSIWIILVFVSTTLLKFAKLQ